MDRRSVARALVVGATYLLAAQTTWYLQDIAGLGGVFWPAVGVAVVGLLVTPRHSWPAILAVVWLVEASNSSAMGSSWVSVAWWATANVVGAGTSAALILRWRAARLDDLRSVIGFFGAVAAGTTLAGTIGAIGAVADGSALAYWLIAVQWIIGDGLGMLTVVPLGLVLFGVVPRATLATLEGVATVACATIVSLVIFLAPADSIRASLKYLVLLPILWAAVRCRVAGAAATLFLTAQIATITTALGRGPFSGPELSPVEASALTQVLLATIAATALLMAARTVESVTYHELARAREHLVAAVSHELRTPLTPIVGFSELLLKRVDELDDPTRRGLEVIERNGRHLTSLIDDLLLASRARRHEIPAEPQAIEVAPLLDAVLHDRRDDAIEVMPASPDAAVWADRTHVTQILTNLLDNADRHGQRPIRIEVQDLGSDVEIAVVDHGTGVPLWFEPQLFDEFSQATTGDLRPTLGLGLGLPLARGLALANDGELVYRRHRSGGTSHFVLTLPADRQSDPR